jgi:hypothetical protein
MLIGLSNCNPPTHSKFIYNSRSTLVPWNFPNGINNNTAIAQNIKGVTNHFFTSYLKI